MLLSPGGIEIEGIFTLRNIEDTDRIKGIYLRTESGDTVIVVEPDSSVGDGQKNLHRTGAEVSWKWVIR